VVARNFTDRNQLDVVTFNNALVANFNYDNAGRKVAANFGNGITETRTYQADNLNTSINTPGVTSFGYTWDANKRKLSQTETGIPLNNQTYSYDDEDRLASFNRNNGDNQAWNLSLVGDWSQFNNNGVMENRTHNAVHEITTVDATPLAHDLKGNLTTNKNGQVYAWDIENRLVSATVPAGCPEGVTGTHTYTYDALGRRVSKTVGGNTTVFISDGMQEITEYVNGAFSQSYVYGSYIDEPLLKTDSAGNKIYYHANNLFSIAALTDNAGTVVERYKYDPYGKATVLAADGITIRPNSLHKNDITWEGRRTDRETNLMYFRQRMYSLDLGIFISRFYKMDVDTHLYRFQFNAPTNYVDPMGDPGVELEWIEWIVEKYNLSVIGAEALHDAITKQGLDKAAIEEMAENIATWGKSYVNPPKGKGRVRIRGANWLFLGLLILDSSNAHAEEVYDPWEYAIQITKDCKLLVQEDLTSRELAFKSEYLRNGDYRIRVRYSVEVEVKTFKGILRCCGKEDLPINEISEKIIRSWDMQKVGELQKYNIKKDRWIDVKPVKPSFYETTLVRIWYEN
jgi:RHS repeat-associated protein